MTTKTHPNRIFHAGKPIQDTDTVLILIHGRGATAESILPLGQDLGLEEAHIIAPQATNHTWYPNSFMEKPERNQPWLDSALSMIESILSDVQAKGVKSDEIVLAGFSQGACLLLEAAARNAQRYKAILAFCGGLIGDRLETSNYHGSFNDTPILMACGDRDPHIHLNRLEETKSYLEKMGAKVHYHIHPNMPHTILPESIEYAQTEILGL